MLSYQGQPCRYLEKYSFQSMLERRASSTHSSIACLTVVVVTGHAVMSLIVCRGQQWTRQQLHLARQLPQPHQASNLGQSGRCPEQIVPGILPCPPSLLHPPFKQGCLQVRRSISTVCVQRRSQEQLGLISLLSWCLSHMSQNWDPLDRKTVRLICISQ